MNPRLRHSSFLILHSAFCIALAALCAANASAVEIQAHPTPPGSGWMVLHGGGGAAFWDSVVHEHASWLTDGFTAFGEASAPAESGHQLAIACNDGGWALLLRFDCADKAAALGGTTEFYIDTDESPAEGRHPPRHIVIHPAVPESEKMVPEYFGAAVPIEARKRGADRSRPYMTEEALPGGFAPTGPVGHEFGVRKGADPNAWYVAAYFRWPAFGLELPFFPKNPRGIRWRLKVIRRAADGSRYVWGADERPYAGYGFIKWPAFSQGFRGGAYRQWIIAGARKPAGAATDLVREYWRVAPLEASYGFIDPGVPTFQPREAASDSLFRTARLAPFLASNDKMLAALDYDSGKGAVAFGWPADEKDRFFSTQASRIYSVQADVDDLRRRYLLDRLLGREVKPPAPKSGKKDKLAAPDPGDIDSVGGTAPAIELDDEAFF